MVASGDKVASTPAVNDEQDPNGDVTLLVIPPEQPPAWKQPRVPSQKGDDADQSTKNPVSKLKVSSAHLKLASAYFAKRLNSCWSEGEALRDKGLVELEMPDTDPEALSLILNIIHGRTWLTPWTLDLEQLTAVAVVVDYLQCHQAVAIMAKLWTDGLRSRTSITISNAAQWIMIGWVFRNSRTFADAARIAQWYSIAEMDKMELPIPESIKGNVDASRLQAIREVASAMHRRQAQLMSDNVPNCCGDCDARNEWGSKLYIRFQQTLACHSTI